MSDCKMPKISAETRDADMRALFGDEYNWLLKELDEERHFLPLGKEKRAFYNAYQGVMVGLFNPSDRPRLKADDKILVASHFRGWLRDGEMSAEDMQEVLEKSDANGVPLSRYMAELSPQAQKDFILMVGAAIQGIQDVPDGEDDPVKEKAFRYTVEETQGLYDQAMLDQLEELRIGSKAEHLGQGIEAGVTYMGSICGPIYTPKVEKHECERSVA